MREILFRGKRLDNGEWVEGYLIKTNGYLLKTNGFAYIVYPDQFADDLFYSLENIICAVDPSTVGQFTGLLDKNGKRIFEHDVVRFDGGVFVVEFIDSRIGFGFSGLHGRGCVPGFTMAHWEHVEVIGNTHDGESGGGRE